MLQPKLRGALFALGIGGLTACGPLPPMGAVFIMQSPPPPRREVVVVAPAPGYVWVEGRWEWRERDYAWVPGAWVRPAPGFREWVPGRWERDRHHGYFWIEGHWR